MQFRRSSVSTEPEINLIPFIDILLVVLIFLVLTTTYSKFNEMRVTLPQAKADAQRNYPDEVIVSVSSEGMYAINQERLANNHIGTLTEKLRELATSNADRVLIINADAQAPHQAVVSVMEASRRAGLANITFATQVPAE